MKKNNRTRFGAFLTAILMLFSVSGCRPADPKNPPKSDETKDSGSVVLPWQKDETDKPETASPIIETDPPEVETLPPETEPVVEAKPPVLTSESGEYYDYGNGIIRVDNMAFEEYGYEEPAAVKYSSFINRVAEELSGRTSVYCMALPSAIGVVLPDDIREIFPRYTDQGAAIDKIYAKMSDDVITVDCHSNLMLHRDEYLYFRTDFHWNGPAAYYAYEAFCEMKGVKPYTLDEREKVEFDNFLGALYRNSCGEDPTLGETPDTVIAYKPYSRTASLEITDRQGNTMPWSIIADVSSWSSATKYSTFAGGDSPFAVFKNPEVKDGSVCVIVKESYGNALLPYLVDHYSTIYEIDYRYWEGNLLDFVKEKQADDLIFANNMSMLRSVYLIGILEEIVK
ncbi:MAG: hypothetical protein E7628_01670 [Ruminococcaceae bacterium]|nr:hypothetical protein [Oscillospiraceae bacterium]